MVQARKFRRVSEGTAIELFPGVYRTTLAYNGAIMICHFRMSQGAHIPLHHHVAAQSGYVICGRLRFFQEGGASHVCEAGEGYAFSPDEPHGADVEEDSEIIECFAPIRPEYLD